MGFFKFITDLKWQNLGWSCAFLALYHYIIQEYNTLNAFKVHAFSAMFICCNILAWWYYYSEKQFLVDYYKLPLYVLTLVGILLCTFSSVFSKEYVFDNVTFDLGFGCFATSIIISSLLVASNFNNRIDILLSAWMLIFVAVCFFTASKLFGGSRYHINLFWGAAFQMQFLYGQFLNILLFTLVSSVMKVTLRERKVYLFLVFIHFLFSLSQLIGSWFIIYHAGEKGYVKFFVMHSSYFSYIIPKILSIIMLARVLIEKNIHKTFINKVFIFSIFLTTCMVIINLPLIVAIGLILITLNIGKHFKEYDNNIEYSLGEQV